MDKNIKYITEMTSTEAKKFFLKSQSYCNIELPGYFNFKPVLKKIDNEINKIGINNIKQHVNLTELRSCDDVNCKIIANKDSRFDWRPLEIINPYLYVYLVNYITQEHNWDQIIDVFNKNKVENVSVASIPVKACGKGKDKKAQILNWWNKVEQESIIMSMKFSSVIHLDISNCYGSIYTHSIAWAIHGKDFAKKNQKPNILGNKIDQLIRLMQNNQTNGIPQGSVLMDFIAEIVLSYADNLLIEELNKLNISKRDYHIIRYRDDYRIFSNNHLTLNIITKTLNDILMDLNFKLNSNKTLYSDEVLLTSIKSDKLKYQSIKSSLYIKNKKGKLIFQLSQQKHLLQILLFSKKYSNSGSLIRMLDEFFNYRINEMSNIAKSDKLQCISIIIEIMLNNTKSIPLCISILSYYLKNTTTEEKNIIIGNLTTKIEKLPNVDMINIWLQRLTIKDDPNIYYSSSLCESIYNSKHCVFNNKWIKTKKYNSLAHNIINKNKIEKMKNYIDIEEVSIFNY